jgi:hypothetical protein
MIRMRRLLTGFLLLLFCGGALAVLGPFTLGRVVLDLAGTEVRGTVISKYKSPYWNRLWGLRSARHVVVAFKSEDQRSLTADISVTRETFKRAYDGGSIDMTYWSPAPQLSSIEPTPWGSPVFVALFALALVLLWICAMVVFRTFAPARAR